MLTHNSAQTDDVEIALVFETENIDQVEQCLKVVLKKHQYRKRKEIYQVNIDILKEIMQGCSELIEKVDIKTKKKITKRNIKDKIKYNYFLLFHKFESNTNTNLNTNSNNIDNNVLDV